MILEENGLLVVEKESLDNDHYIRLSMSVADYYNIINVGINKI